MLLFIDGFNASNPGSDAGNKYNPTGSTLGSTNTGNPRTGARAMQGSGPPRLVSRTLTPSGDARMGMAIYIPATYQTGNIMEIREGTTIHVAVNIDATGHLVVKRGSTVLATGTSVVGTGAYFYVELGATIHDSTGSYEVRLNGVTELSASGVDTRNGGTGVWDNVVWAYSGHDNGAMIDDIYVCDTSGSKNNDFLGAIRVYTMIAQSDAIAAGSNADFTPSTGTNHGALVDEATPNADTDYNTGINNGDIDSYELDSITVPSGLDVLGIQVNSFVKKTDVAARTGRNVIVTASGVWGLSTQSPNTSYAYQWDIVQDNPDLGSAFVQATLDSLEAGYEIVS